MITLYNKKGDKKRFHMESKRPLLDEDDEDGGYLDRDLIVTRQVMILAQKIQQTSSSSSSEDEVDVAYLVVDKEENGYVAYLVVDKEENGYVEALQSEDVDEL